MTWRRQIAPATVLSIIAAVAGGSVLSSAPTAGLPSGSKQRRDAAIIGRDKPVDGVLAGGEVGRYTLVLEPDRAGTLIVAHRSIDLVLRVFETDAEPDIEIASDGPTGELRLPIHATQSDRIIVEVAAAYPRGDAGSYTVRLDDVHPATAADRQLSEAHRHHTRAMRLRSVDAFVAALQYAEEALTRREEVEGAHGVAVARTLLLLAQLNDDLARFDAAEPLYSRARRIVETNREDHQLLLAQILDREAAHRGARARYSDAEPLATRALTIREQLLGPRHVLVATSLGTLADLNHENARFREAAGASERAFELAAQAYRPSDTSLGDFIDRVARSQLALGNFARAEQLYRQSLEVRGNAGPENLALAASLTGLARVALLANDNVKAEQMLVQTLAIKEKILGPGHPQVANDLFNLGLVHYRRRDYASAIARYLRALEVREKTLGPSHPLVASTLNNMGLVYWRQRDYPRAEEFLGRALKLYEDTFGPDSLRVANPLANLGIIAKESGSYVLAETRYKRALAIKEKHLGPDHPDLIAPIESLAILYRDRGDYTPAEELFQRTLRISETSLGPDHPFVARHLDNIAHLTWATGSLDRAFDAWQRLLAIEERNVPLNIATGSERQKLAFFEPHLRNLEEAISFHVQHPADRPDVRDLALTTLLRRKGRVLDALADSFTAFRDRAKPEDEVLLAELTQVTSTLAAAVLGDSTGSAKTERRRLAAERERLEAEIHRRSAGYLAPSQAVTLAAVQNALPPHAALIEYALYRPFDPGSSSESRNLFGPPRYVAYVLHNAGEAGWRDLGPAAEIDRIVDRFRTALTDPDRPGMASVARELYQRLIAPLLPLVGDTEQLLISPDGPLNLIPFEALRSGAGRYLVEDAAISYLTTGRDLVRMLTPRPQATGMVVFANPDFGEPNNPAAERRASPAVPRDQRRLAAAADRSSVYFAPLAGTESEAQRIRTLFPDLELRLGARATEHALKKLERPRILHIATHGFFLQEDRSSEAKAANTSGTRAVNAAARIENPLLRSGLAFAGANLTRIARTSAVGERDGGSGGVKSSAEAEDGILTALEAANLNLWGTRLVTLSACDTGVGVVRNGEGVYGLRRAFFLAGAESIVMSLWPVSDLITREMMTGYYGGLKQGLGRGAALRRVQLQMLKRPRRSHPFYWASFIQAGEWASLDGRR